MDVEVGALEVEHAVGAAENDVAEVADGAELQREEGRRVALRDGENEHVAAAVGEIDVVVADGLLLGVRRLASLPFAAEEKHEHQVAVAPLEVLRVLGEFEEGDDASRTPRLRDSFSQRLVLENVGLFFPVRGIRGNERQTVTRSRRRPRLQHRHAIRRTLLDSFHLSE